MTGVRQKKRLDRMSVKRGVGRPPTGLNQMIAIRWEPWLIAGIERYGKQHLLSRPQALRHIVVKALTQARLVDPKAHMYKEAQSP
jgi:hypothetical protein